MPEKSYFEVIRRLKAMLFTDILQHWIKVRWLLADEPKGSYA